MRSKHISLLWVVCFFVSQKIQQLQNTRSRGRGWIQIQLLPPYIYLDLPVSTPKPTDPPPRCGSNPAPWIFVLHWGAAGNQRSQNTELMTRMSRFFFLIFYQNIQHESEYQKNDSYKPVHLNKTKHNRSGYWILTHWTASYLWASCLAPNKPKHCSMLYLRLAGLSVNDWVFTN